MSLTELTVRNRHAVWALAIAAAVFGVLAYGGMPMKLFPDTSPPVVSVTTAWPGASAEDVAESVSRPIEEELASIEGVVEVGSSSQDNLSLVTIEFDYDRNLDIAAVDVQNAVSRIRETLPDSIREPQVLKLDTSDRPVITVGVSSGDLVDARQRAEDVWAPEVQRVDGVAAVDVFGGAEEAVVVELDRSKLESYRIPFFRVVKEIRTSDAAMPAGTLRTERTRTSFRVESRAEHLERLGRVPFVTPDGSRVLLRDLAKIERGSLDDDARFSIDGKRTIAMQVFETEEANTVEVVGHVTDVVDEWNRRYDDVEFIIGEEDASFTEQSIDNLLTNVWQALLLASIIVFLFIGRLRASMVAVVSMPLSYGITFALMKATGTEFNMVTLSAVILAVGMVVDAAVVVLENIMRRRTEDDLDAEEAAIVGTDEIRTAVLAGVATTVIVLVPLLFLTGFVGKTFGPLAMTLLFAFTSSVLVALVLVPVLTIYTRGDSVLDDVGAKIVQPFRWAMDKLRSVYLGVLRGALSLRLVTLLVAGAMFVGGVLLIRHQGMEVLPKMDSGNFFVSLQTPSGSSLPETERVVRHVEEVLGAEEEVVKIQSQMGFEQGMKTFSSTGAQGPTQGFITVTLSPRTEREETIWEIEERVRRKISRIPGIRTVTVREMGNTAKSTTAAPIVVRLSGPDPLVLDRLGETVVEKLGGVPNVVEPVRNWRIDQKRMQVEVDELRADQLGLTPVEVGRQMLAGSDGIDAGEYHGGGASTPPIRVRYDRSDLQQPSDLLDFPVFAPKTHEPVGLRSVASLRQTTGQALVTRKNFSPTLEVTAATRGRALSFVTADVREAMGSIEMPRDYELELSGERDDMMEARSKLGGAFALSLIAVYLLLVAQLRSFLHPVTIMGSVPLSLAGVGGALWLMGKPVSMPVMVGLILLVGTVVNNAILLIDFIRQARERGAERRDAIEQSVAVRFRPIMMTALSTIVGMLPLAAEWALGAERFSPLAIAVIGGLIAATFLTMVVIPVIYDLFEDIAELLRRLGGRLRESLSKVTGVGIVLLAAGAVAWVPTDVRAEERLELDVDEAIEMAESYSHDIESEQSKVEAAEARRKEARGRFLPRLDVKAKTSKLSEVEPGNLEIPSAQPGMEAPEVQFGEAIDESYSLRATLTQPLFTGLRIKNGWDAAGDAVTLSEKRETKARADVKLQVTEAYFRLYRARKLREVADESVDLLEEHRDRVQRLEEADRATALDVSRVESRLADARLERERARGGARIAERRLETLLGVETETNIVLTEGDLDTRDCVAGPSRAGGKAVSSDGDVAKTRSCRMQGLSFDREHTLTELAVKNRPELEINRAAAEVKAERSAALKGALWPQLYLKAGYTLANPHERYFPPESEFNDSWDVSIVLSWRLWDWGTTFYRAKAVEHEAEAMEHRVDRLEDFTKLSVEKRRIELETAQRRVAAAKRSVETAEQALETAVRTYEAGRLASTDVLETEVELTRAKAKLVTARTERRLAAAKLERLIGR